MAKRRIFVSHSSKGPAGLALLTAVAAALEGQDYALLLDRQNLVPGDNWYQEVSDYMMACEGAVLLWDRNAATSAYVRHEASVLSHRWRTEAGNFKLFVALIDDAPPDQRLTKTQIGSGDLRASRIADAHIWEAPEDVRGNPAGLAGALAARAVDILGAGRYSTTRRDRIIEALRKQLDTNLDSDQLREAVEQRGSDALVELIDKLPARHLSRALAGWMVDQAAIDLDPLRDLVEGFRGNLKGGHKTILDLLRLAESDWLSKDRLACPIGAAVVKRGQGAVAAVNGWRVPDYTLKRLALRALDHGDSYLIIPCHDRALDEEEVAEEMRSGLSRHLVDDVSLDDVPYLLRQERTVCLLPKKQPVGAGSNLLGALAARFPSVIFVAWPAEEEQCLSDITYGQAIAPPIDREREQAHHIQWLGFRSLLDRQ